MDKEEAIAQISGGDTITRLDAGTLFGFGFLVLLVASNVVAIRFTNQELPPFWAGGTRLAGASMLFFIYTWWRSHPLPRGRALLGTLLFGVLQFGTGFALAYWALLEVPAGLASVIFATVPLFTLLFAVAAQVERLEILGFAGSVLAIGGIAVIFGERMSASIPSVYLFAAVGAAGCFALAPVVVKAYPPVHLAPMNAVGMLTGTLILLGISRFLGEPALIPTHAATWVAQFYLTLPGSIGVFGLMLALLRRWTASGVSYQAVLSPIVAILLSRWLLQEPLTSGLLLGGALVLVGVYAGALAPNSVRHLAIKRGGKD